MTTSADTEPATTSAPASTGHDSTGAMPPTTGAETTAAADPTTGAETTAGVGTTTSVEPGSTTSGGDATTGDATTGDVSTGEDTNGTGGTGSTSDATTGGDACGLTVSPGMYTYQCFCELGGCEVNLEDVAEIDGFYDTYCECLCQKKGCGGAAGGEVAG